ncbi:membrane protein [Saccharopolyspora rosea]|uniref:Lipase (Class 3) n=1 Tax=Saccharopolyspora rosea TaxID=524884 RepID=A0ABW3G069_9PSEU
MQAPGRDTRVVELRVHGILGTTGNALTDSVASVDVAGDGVGRIVRPADRLRRPVEGPNLPAGDGSVPRVVEGYVWGGMTSGGLAKASWALLFPFALANVAHWMLPPVRPGDRVGGLISGVLRAVMRLSALLLTMLFVAQLTVIGLDLVAAQCLSPGAQCLTFVPDAVRHLDVVRSAITLLPVGLAVLLMYRISGVSWRVSAGAREAAQESGRAPMLPGANVVADPDTPALRAMHITAALSTVALLVLGGPLTPSLDPRWLAAAALLVIALVGTVAIDDPAGLYSTEEGRRGRVALGRPQRRTLMTVAALVFTSVALMPGSLDHPLDGSGSTIDLITVGLITCCLVVAVLLVPAALLARSAWASLPSRLRPWAGGWMSAPMLMIACMLGNGFGAGFALTVRKALGDPALQLPAGYDDVTVFWGIATVLLLVGGAGMAVWTLVTRLRAPKGDDMIPAEVSLLHAGRQTDQRAAANAWKWADLQRRYSHHVLLLIAGVLAFSTVLTLVSRLVGMPADALWPDWLVALGVGALATLAGGLLRVVYIAARQRTAARYLGVLSDLSLFWPREAHPVVPPCYALKVIPELAARAKDHLSDPNTRVVLVGHSQGSLLAAVATARLLETLPEEDRERVGLVTAGSQLQWAYPRAFPAVVPHRSLRDLAGSLGGRWRSLCRGTDPLGGAVTTWNRQVYDGMLIGVGLRPDGSEGPLPAATRGPTGALVLGGDHWLPDPQRGPFSSRRWAPGVMAHTDYTGDPEWDRAVAMAAGLETPVRCAALPLQSKTPTPTSAPVQQPRQKSPDGPRLHAQGGDGGSLSDSVEELAQQTEDRTEAPADDEPTQRTPDAAESTESSPGAAPQDTDTRTGPAVPPEITEPRGRTAPWERGMALRLSEN